MSRLTMRTVPQQLVGATRFSDDPIYDNNFAIINWAKQYPDLMAEFRLMNRKVGTRGPARMSGVWGLIYLCFLSSRITDFQPWYHKHCEDWDLWQACEFTKIPSYDTIYLRFRELEEYNDIAEYCTQLIIARARAQEPQVGARLHIDSTEAESSAHSYHACGPNDNCPTRGSRRQPHLNRLDTSVVRAIRHKAADRPEDDTKPLQVDGYSQLQILSQERDDTDGTYLAGGHRWRRRDPDAGYRIYTRGSKTVREWPGYYETRLIDHLTMAPVAVRLMPANRNEDSIYDELLDLAIKNIGAVPLIVAGDKGFSKEHIFRSNSQRGIASVFPYRRVNGAEPKKRVGNDIHDEHGHPRCQYCKGDTDFVRFDVREGNPRVWFRCSLPLTKDCAAAGDQSISCNKAPRYLLPLWRTEPAYMAMRQSHQVYESTHHAERARYHTGPDDKSIRPKRLGIRCQQLRSTMGVLLDWIRIMVRAGWDGVHAATSSVFKPTPYEPALSRLLRARNAARRNAGAGPP